MAGRLISLADRTPEERRAIARAGGEASGKVRRFRKAVRLAVAEELDTEETARILRERIRKEVRDMVSWNVLRR